MPAEHVNFGKTWTALHPGWEMWTWTEKNIAPLRLDECRAWHQCGSASQRSDVIRFHALLYYGGVYLDTDFECLKNIESLLKGQSFVVAREDNQWIGSAFIASVPGHPVLVKAIDELHTRGIDPKAPQSSTGPPVLTRALNGQAVNALPASLFYPYHWTELHRRGEVFPEAFGVHHWNAAQGWVKK